MGLHYRRKPGVFCMRIFRVAGLRTVKASIVGSHKMMSKNWNPPCLPEINIGEF